MPSTKSKTWFKGLDALRFFAAFLVLLMHVHLGIKQAGLPLITEIPILLKGFSAVSFFFVLSGFLITYLLFSEIEKTNTVDVKVFYLKRVFRIWPLYFLIVGFGLFFYWTVVPALGISFPIDYSKPLAVFLYVFFAANLMNSIYHVGGMLHVTWSIAVEEQFYLFWAPLMRRFKNQVPYLIAFVTVFFWIVNTLNGLNFFGLSEGLQVFVNTLQFHYMGIGASIAYLLYFKRKWLLGLVIFTSKRIQFLLLGSLVSFLFFYSKSTIGEAIFNLPLGLLFAWLILNVSVNKRSIINLDKPVLNYLGSISYGVYMLHMPIVYALSFIAGKLPLDGLPPLVFFTAFLTLTMLSTITAAHISQKVLEQPILKWGRNVIARSKNKLQAIRLAQF